MESGIINVIRYIAAMRLKPTPRTRGWNQFGWKYFHQERLKVNPFTFGLIGLLFIISTLGN